VDRQLENIGNAEDYEVAGGAKSEGQFRLDWSEAGLYVEEPIISDVESGIDRVIQVIKSDRFRVFKNLHGLRDELGSYSRKVDTAGNPTDEIQDKRKYHRLDALRYIGDKLAEESGVYVGQVQMGRL
jgi:hypothetical protein